MKSNRSKDTQPEVRLRKALWAAGLRGYRKNVASLLGKPDIVFRRRRLAIFVHGCFWHGCPTCGERRNLRPTANKEYWADKIAANRARDAKNSEALHAQGWSVLVLWECEVRTGVDACVGRVQTVLGQSQRP